MYIRRMPHHRPDLHRVLALTILTLATSACCGGSKSKADEERTPIAPETKTKQVSAPGAPATAGVHATIAAGNEPGGAPRRGIVRASPDFKGAEVTRLTNGTAIGIDERIHGGWLKIHWPPGGGATGYIHRDVVKE